MPNMNLKKTPMPEQCPNERNKNFLEVTCGYTEEMAIEEAGRCLNCKHKPCMQGCPVGVKIPEFIEYVARGEFEEAYLGIFAYDKEVVQYLKNDIDFNEGIYIVKISKDGPVAKTKIKMGDIITKIDGNNINKMSELISYIYRKKPGEKITLTINRQGQESSQEIYLGKR